MKEAAKIKALFGQSAKAKWRWREGYDDHYVDLLTQVGDYRFAAAAEDSLLVDVGTLRIPILSKRKLIVTKRIAAHNPERGKKAKQDNEDIEALSNLPTPGKGSDGREGISRE